MISLSRIIKSVWAQTEKNNQRRIEIKIRKMDNDLDPVEEMIEPVINQEELDLIYHKANEEAHQIVQTARQEAKSIQLLAEEERDHWFQTERVRLEEEAKQLGYREGHEVGIQQG